jgi:hypothetical protein
MDNKLTARDHARIDAALEGSTRSIEGQLHRRFYPELATRYFDWPNSQRTWPWRVWLDDNELISVNALSSGGISIPSSNYFLRRADNRDEPPYTYLELNLSTNSAFGGGPTWQRDITITGLWGYRNDEAPAGAAAAAATSSATTLTVGNSATVGAGDLLRIGTERLIVTDTTMVSTGQTLQAPLTAAVNDVTAHVSDGTAYSVGEVLLLDAERLLVQDIAGNSLAVKRGWDGTILAAHTTPTVFAARQLTVTRGVLGTTAAAISQGDAIARWTPPGPVHNLAIAEALITLQMQTGGYAQTRRTGGTGDNAERPISNAGLVDLRAQTYTSHGRKARIRGV